MCRGALPPPPTKPPHTVTNSNSKFCNIKLNKVSEFAYQRMFLFGHFPGMQYIPWMQLDVGSTKVRISIRFVRTRTVGLRSIVYLNGLIFHNVLDSFKQKLRLSLCLPPPLPPPAPSPQPKERGAYCFWCGSRRRPRCLLSALYLLTQWVDFDQTCTLLGGRKKWLDFCDLDLIFKVTPALWNFQILTKTKSLSAPFLLNQMADSGQISYILMLGWFKNIIRFWWPWPNFQGHHTIKTVRFSNFDKKSLSAPYLLNQIKDSGKTSYIKMLGWLKKIPDYGDLDLISRSPH